MEYRIMRNKWLIVKINVFHQLAKIFINIKKIFYMKYLLEEL